MDKNNKTFFSPFTFRVGSLCVDLFLIVVTNVVYWCLKPHSACWAPGMGHVLVRKAHNTQQIIERVVHFNDFIGIC